MRSGERESCNAVIERGCIPTHGGVADGAIGGGKRRARCRMHGVIGLLPGGQMAAGVSAIVCRNLQVVVVIDVTGSTRHVGVSVGQQKSRDAVVERSRIPAHRGVTDGAIGGGKRRARCRMHGVIGLLPGGQMAADVSAVV